MLYWLMEINVILTVNSLVMYCRPAEGAAPINMTLKFEMLPLRNAKSFSRKLLASMYLLLMHPRSCLYFVFLKLKLICTKHKTK